MRNAMADYSEGLRDLALTISRLPDTELTELKSLIRKLQPDYCQPGIDLNALSPWTLVQVQQFVHMTFIEYHAIMILISDTPKDSTIDYYVEAFRHYGVTDVVRTCDAEYLMQPLLDAGMRFHDWRFNDGDVATDDIIENWLALVDEIYLHPKNEHDSKRLVAVHCSAGLGRAPFLVALALIQGGMENGECVKFIRAQRKGAINKAQLDYILRFRPRKNSIFKKVVRMLTHRTSPPLPRLGQKNVNDKQAHTGTLTES